VGLCVCVRACVCVCVCVRAWVRACVCCLERREGKLHVMSDHDEVMKIRKYQCYRHLSTHNHVLLAQRCYLAHMAIGTASVQELDLEVKPTYIKLYSSK
jgi:hypothetical protein